MKLIRINGLAVIAWIGATASAGAQEFCITCTAPDAMYRCVIADPRPGSGQSLQAACITALAKDGKHGQCALKSGVTVFQCDAAVKRVSVAAEPVVLAPPPPKAPDPSAPPATVVEAVKRAQVATEKSLQAQNEKIGDAAKATGDFLKRGLVCVGTLFFKCQ